MEIKESFRYPVFEIIICVLLFFLFLTAGGASNIGLSINSINLFTLLPYIYRSVVFYDKRYLLNIFLFEALIIPVIVNYRLAQAIEKKEVETLLLLPIKRAELFFIKILSIFLVFTIINSTLYILWRNLLMQNAFWYSDYPSMIIIIAYQTLQITIVSILISTVVKRFVPATIVSLLAFQAIYYLSEIFRNTYNPIFYLMPPQSSNLLFTFLGYFGDLPYPHFDQILGNNFDYSLSTTLIFGSITILILAVISGYYVFTKKLEFEKEQ
ncbi:hypothetical protein JW865_02320 [Candidatus Bathyarchaeota archaeon]|nr:hypothetical protein [Candidatus Bathyarchaeota archaeon]